MHVLGCLTAESREVQIEQVITRFTHSAPIRASIIPQAPSGQTHCQSPFGITMDLASLSWEILGRSAIASLELSIWVYLPYEGEIQAVSLTHEMKTLVRIPEIKPSMRIDAKFRVEDIEVVFDETHGGTVIEALAFIEGIVLEKCILQVVTQVKCERGFCPARGGGEQAGSRFIDAVYDLFKRILHIFRLNR